MYICKGLTQKILRLFLIAAILSTSLFIIIPSTSVFALDVQPAASGDDAYVKYDNTGAGWGFFNALANNSAGYYSNSTDKTGGSMRFVLNVARDSVIDTAYITFTAKNTYANADVNTEFWGHDTDDSAQFADLAAYQAARGTDVGGANNDNLTTATVSWDTIAGWTAETTYQSPELKTIIQEIVNREGWASGQHITIFWDDHEDTSTNNNFTCRDYYTYDGSAAKSPTLHVESSGSTELADVIALEATSISTTTATFNGYILDLNGAGNVTTRGFEWGTTWGTYPNDESTAGSFGVGAYTESVAGLPSGTRIYYRAYVINANGTSYGQPLMYYNTSEDAGGGGVYTIGLATTQNQDFTGFVKHDYNPVKSKDAPESNIKDPSVIIIGSTIYMYYSVHLGGGVYEIEYATSTDGGVNFTEQGTALGAYGAGFESAGVGACSVYDTEVVGSHRYAMMYSGVMAGVMWSGVGYAYSADGITWNRGSSNPVVPLGTSGTWDDYNIWGTSTIAKVGNTYYMHYGGKADTTVRWDTGLVTWTDFTGTYTKSASNPIISPETTAYAVLTANTNIGTGTVTVANTALFEVDMPVWINDDATTTSNDEFNRIVSIDSATQMTLDEVAERNYTSGAATIRSWAYGAVTPQSTLIYDPNSTPNWTLLNCAFLPYSDAGTRESSGYMTSENGIDWTYDYTNSPPIPLDWNGGVISAENPRVLLDGMVSQFTTITSNDPAVTTIAATDVGTTTATLQGTLSSLGGETTAYVYFQYGLTVAYGTTTVEQTKTAIGGYNQAITGLSTNTLYHFRAVVRFNGLNYAYGTDYTLTTGSGIAPSPPTNFRVSSYTSTSITLAWTKGTGATNTVIKVSTSTYPTSVNEGDAVYNGTALTTTYSDLTSGTKYYFSAWSSDGGSVYSATYVTVMGTPTADILRVPDTLEIESVQVFTNYQTTADQLLVYSFTIAWDDGMPATFSPSDFFYVQVLDGATVVKQDRIKQWGYVPGSLYISASVPLTWNYAYTFKIIGTSKFTTPPSVTYTMSAANYVGNDYDYLTQWVIDMATRMEQSIYWDITLLDYVNTSYMLTSQGAQVFNTAIPGIAGKCPSLFSPVYSLPDDPDNTIGMETAQSMLDNAENNNGTYLWRLYGNWADVFGVETAEAGLWMWLLVFLALVLLLASLKVHFVLSLVISLPVVFVMVQLGLMSMSVLIGITLIIAVIWLFKILGTNLS